jgi:hypothetical protein
VFYYARNGAAALARGKLVQSVVTHADLLNEQVGTASTVGAYVVPFTPAGSTTYVANELAEGYYIVNDGTGEGQCYKIRSHPATAAGTAFNLELYDPIVVATVAGATSEHSILKNPWADVVISAGAVTQFGVGVPATSITASTTGTKYHFWCQTWGVCAGWDVGTAPIGAAVGASTTGGAFDEEAAGDAALAINLFLGIAGDYGAKWLTIAP